MLRLIRLAASAVVLVSGLWLASRVVLQWPVVVESTEKSSSRPPQAPREMPRLIEAVGSVSGSCSGSCSGLADEAPAELPVPPTGLAEVAEVVCQPASRPVAEPLPDLPPGFSARPPMLGGVYRSALDLPPPPLLDAEAPPPLAGSSWPAGPAGGAGGPVAAVTTHAPPPAATYVVRDGDDLTAIAVRLYGHPAAAERLWEANRDRLTSPQLLPIGVSLRVPGDWPRGRAPKGRSGWIEPAGSSGPAVSGRQPG